MLHVAQTRSTTRVTQVRGMCVLVQRCFSQLKLYAWHGVSILVLDEDKWVCIWRNYPFIWLLSWFSLYLNVMKATLTFVSWETFSSKLLIGLDDRESRGGIHERSIIVLCNFGYVLHCFHIFKLILVIRTNANNGRLVEYILIIWFSLF